MSYRTSETPILPCGDAGFFPREGIQGGAHAPSEAAGATGRNEIACGFKNESRAGMELPNVPYIVRRCRRPAPRGAGRNEQTARAVRRVRPGITEGEAG